MPYVAKGCQIGVLSIEEVCKIITTITWLKKKCCTLETPNTTLQFVSLVVTYTSSSIRMNLDLYDLYVQNFVPHAPYALVLASTLYQYFHALHLVFGMILFFVILSSNNTELKITTTTLSQKM